MSTETERRVTCAGCPHVEIHDMPMNGKMASDTMSHGTGFMRGGKHISRGEVLKTPEDLEQERTCRWVSMMENECWDLRCINVPTGGDDCDVHWQVINHYEAEPHERVIGYGTTPLEALQEAYGADDYWPSQGRKMVGEE